MKREEWKSHLGFIWSASGSAIGLGTIWRFPYIAGENGGALFFLLFIFFLLLISFPVLLSELFIGKKGGKNPQDSFAQVGKKKSWRVIGGVTIWTGLLVSAFYSVICAWTLGYLIEALWGHLHHFTSGQEAAIFFQSRIGDPLWLLFYLFLFLLIASSLLYFGVQKGIERSNKVMMPLLFCFLLFLAIHGVRMDRSGEGISFLLAPKWGALSGSMALNALGQAFFALSLGQGTMVTYGSYLGGKKSLIATSFPIVISVIIVSLLSGLAIFPATFAAGIPPTSGTALVFETLPILFSQMKGGGFFLVLFFLLIFFAALTSQISAMEPLISFFTDRRWSRHQAVFVTTLLVLGGAIPISFSFNILSNFRPLGSSLFNVVSLLSINWLIPLGGLAAILLVRSFQKGEKEELLNTLLSNHLSKGVVWMGRYFLWSLSYFIPLMILILLFF